MRHCGLIAAVAVVALVTALPASAGHYPPNAVAGDVTMTLSRAGAKLTMSYTVNPPRCSRSQGCEVNWDKPYLIKIFVDAPGKQTGTSVPRPRGISVPSNCTVVGFPLVSCNTPSRSLTDPAAALPLSGTITLRVGTIAGATAEIDVAGWNLNTYQQGISVPEWDCAQVDADVHAAEQVLITAEAASLAAKNEYKTELREFIKIENAAFMWFRVGGLYVAARSRALEFLRESEWNLTARAGDVAVKRHNLQEARAKLASCLGERVAQKSRPATGARPASCTEEQWIALVERGQAIKIKNTAPFVRKILRELKAKKRAQAARHKKRLHALLKPELKALRALGKAISACE